MPAAISTRFAEMLTKGDGYQVVARVEVFDKNGAVILDSATDGSTLYVTGGSITVDWTASFARSISNLQIVDPTYALVPMSKTDYFSPAASNEIGISVGAMVDGAPEYIPQGIFHLETAKVEDSAEGLSITLSAYDRARKYARSARVTGRKFLASGDPTFPGGWPIYEAISALLGDAFPGTPINHDRPPTLLPEQNVLQGDDPWKIAREWAESMGYLLFFDRYGNCQLRKVPNPSEPATTVHWSYAEGQGGLLGVVRDQTNANVYNGVAVEGHNPSNGDAVKSDIFWDDDPNSATYVGVYGYVPCFIQTDKVRTVPQANEMAKAELNKNKGLVEAVEFDIVPNPAIDPGDTVKLTRERAGFPASGPGSEAVIVDSYTVNLSATGGAMTVRCRQRRVG